MTTSERHTAISINVAAKAALIVALLASAGCVRIGTKPPSRLLTIASSSQVEAGVPASASRDEALFIDEPSVPQSLATPRVAVRATDTTMAYVADAVWVDTPSRQFQALLSETVRARSNILVLDPEQYLARAGRVLNGSLVEFGIDAARQQAVVTYDATMASPDGLKIKRQRFTASAPVSRIDADSVAPAISAAANQVAVAVSDWIATSN
jgi:cholesterol transport system auxiliary component